MSHATAKKRSTTSLGGEKHAARPLPAVVLLDLKLPKVGGLEILRRMRAENGTHRPVVTPTSSNEHTDVVNGYDAGANSYVCSRSGATPSPLQ
jgi:two-component system response regulator